MSLYYMKFDNGDKFELNVINSLNYSAPQSIIQYETPGGNGGQTLNTGRKNKTITLQGTLLTALKFKAYIGEYTRIFTAKSVEKITDKNKIKKEIEKYKENGTVFSLFSPITSVKDNKYVIRDLNINLNPGNDYLQFNMTITEYRQASVKTGAINLVNSKSNTDFTDRYNQLQATA